MAHVTPLKLAIVHSGRTQRDIASTAGINEAQFSRIVNGLHASDATRAAIAQALDVPEADLWPVTQSRAA